MDRCSSEPALRDRALKGLASLAISQPRRVLAAWLALVGVLALLGMGVEARLHRSNLIIPGTTAQRAIESLEPKFGENFDQVVVLEGPRRAIDRQGPKVTAALEGIDGISLLAPWLGVGEGLRPQRNTALIVIRAQGDFDHVSKEVAPEIRRRAKGSVSAPVQAYASGYPDIAAGIHGGTVEAIQHAELIAVPLLIVILLLVFKSPVAAALPLFIGLTTIGAARGGLTLINEVFALDALSLNIASMMGLALGVDYALLMVSRFREELGSGLSPTEAALRTGERTGRTISSAGIALVAAMFATTFVVPGSLLLGVTMALISTVVLSVFGALIALPAVLALLGTNVDRWTFGDVNRRSRFGGLALRALRNPALAVALSLLAVCTFSAMAAAVETGPPDPRGLPPNEERSDYLAVKRALGAGWIAPYEIGITSDEGPLTEPGTLAATERFQRKLAARPDVAAVLGPGQLVGRTRQLQQVPARLSSTRRFLKEGLANQGKLAEGLAGIGSGVSQMHGGLVSAAGAAGRLEAGGNSAASAAAELDSGLENAARGAEKLQVGMSEARAAIDTLSAGSRRARRASEQVGNALARTRPGLLRGLPQVKALRTRLSTQVEDLERLSGAAVATQRGLERGLRALEQLDPDTKLDPHYDDAYNAFAGALAAIGSPSMEASLAEAGESAQIASEGVGALVSQTRGLAAGLGRLHSGSERLGQGLERLDEGVGKLLAGFERLDAGDGALTAGLSRLQTGSGELASGVRRLAGGVGTLRGGLSGGADEVTALGEGVSDLLSGVLVFRGRSHRIAEQTRQTDRLAPVFESGYFTLAAVDRASPQARRNASFALSVDSGGSGARVTVVGYGEAQKAGHPLRGVLEEDIEDLAKETGAQVQLSGTATALQDFDAATSHRLPQLALALSLVTFLVLVGVLRSLLLPFLAVVFNLLTVGAAFGVMVLFFQGSDPILGGPGFIDAITAYGIFSIMFGLSIDYEVFLLTRMREGHLRSGSNEEAIRYGVERTAGVITGAALIMTAVFVSFATTGITAARQLGLAMTVAVLVDATLIRLVLLPSAMKLCGDATWWLPKPLRRLPSQEKAG